MYCGAVLLVAFVRLAAAFKDYHPLVLVSNSLRVTDEVVNEEGTSNDELAMTMVSSCKYDEYIVINQKGFNELSQVQNNTHPMLAAQISQAKQVIAVPEYYDPNIEHSLTDIISEACKVSRVAIVSEKNELNYVDTEKTLYSIWSDSFEQSDALLTRVVESMPTGNYLIVYTSAEGTAEGLAEGEADELIETESKETETKETTEYTALFTNYAFFSPGIFMGFLTCLLLVGILSAAVTGVSSLQVSYKSFDPPPAK